jgi:hypothetical protein
MTLQTRNLRRAVKGAVASGAMAVGLLMGVGSTTADADVLDDVGVKYMQGAGGGQISNFVKEALILRAQGFKPSKGNLEELQAGWDYLPNQTRLVEALKDTVAYQRKMQALQQNAVPSQQGGFNIGGPPPNPGNSNNTGIGVIPGTGITQPVG